MTKEEKIKVILEAVASKKASATEIEPSRKGATISALKKGQNVYDSTVDKLYESLKKIIAGKEQGQKSEKKTKVQSKKQSSTKAKPPKAQSIEQGSTKEPGPIEQREQSKEQSQTVIEQTETKSEQSREEHEMKIRIDALEHEIQKRDERIGQLEERLSRIESTIESTIEARATREQSEQRTEQSQGQDTKQSEQSQEQRSVMGFRLVQKTTYTKWQDQRLAYRKWYAVNGKQVVYVGDDPGKAEEKIKAYLEKHS